MTDLFEYLLDNIDESSIDYPREDLDKSLWSKDGDSYILKPEAKEKILDILKQYQEQNLIEIADKIRIVGSITGNQYTDDADIDIHIVPEVIKDWSEFEVDKVKKWFRDNLESIDGYIEQHPIEVYIQTNPAQDLMSIGVYNILEDEWEKEPTVVPLDFDPYENFSDIFDELRNLVDDADSIIGELRRDIIDYDTIKEAINRLPRESQQKLLEHLKEKLEEIEQDIDNLYTERGKWVKLRQDASKPTTPEQALKDVKLTKEWEDTNATFKFINRYHYLKVIDELEAMLDDNHISDDEIDRIKDIIGGI